MLFAKNSAEYTATTAATISKEVMSHIVANGGDDLVPSRQKRRGNLFSPDRSVPIEEP